MIMKFNFVNQKISIIRVQILTKLIFLCHYSREELMFMQEDGKAKMENQDIRRYALLPER